MRTSITIFVTAAAALGLSACSLVVDSGEFTGGDGGIHVDRDSDTPGDGVLQDLFDAQDDRVREWCACFANQLPQLEGDETACVQALTPPAAYRTCIEEALADHEQPASQGSECQAALLEEAASCESAAMCAPGEFAQCGFDFTQVLYASVAECFPVGYEPFFQQVAECAREHVVGTSSRTCPGDFLNVSTAVGWTLQAGEDFDLRNSPCHPVDATGTPTNTGTADVFVHWSPVQTGPVVIDTLGTTFDTILYVVDECETDDSRACNDDIAFGSGIVQSRIELAEVADDEELLVVLSGWSAPEFGAARINFTTLWCLDIPPAHDTPDEGGQVDLDIDSQTGDSTFQGTIDLVGVSRLEPETCAEGESGDEHVEAVVAWRAPTGGTYRIDTEGTLFDNVLYVRRSCDPDSSDGHFDLACDDGDPDAGEVSAVTVSLMAQETVIIVVDSKDDPAGDAYRINIERIN
jgi:hypothetical protein